MNRNIRRNTIATVSTMAKALAARDAYTQGHAERVGRIAGMVAAEIGLDAGETERVELAGLLHDIGKIGFPDSLFLPHDGDNPKEVVKEITRHPATGAEILKGLEFLGLGPIRSSVTTTSARTAADTPSTSRGTTSRWAPGSLPWPMPSTPSPPTGPTRRRGPMPRRWPS